MNPYLRKLLIVFVIPAIFLPWIAAAQLSQGGIPSSYSYSLTPLEQDVLVVVSPPATDVLQKEDEPETLPYRFAVNLPVDLNISVQGRWEKVADGINICRLGLKSPGALAITLYFDQFYIPVGGKLYVYNPRRTQCLGAFTSLNNSDMQTFATSLIFGEELTLEYNAPDGLPEPRLHVSEIAYAYRGVAEYNSLKTGFGSSGKCQVNVNCSEGIQWYNQKRAVTRIEIKKGTSTVWCTGSLVNNTRNDGKPYVLTADHCGFSATTADIHMWIFYFDYESLDCPNPVHEPLLRSMTGASLVARSGGSAFKGSDFFMVILDKAIPDSFNVYYNGWSAEGASSLSGTGIHHPQGDIKKISTYIAPLQPSSYPGNPDQAHWQVNWSATTHGYGTTEGGSSGSPIFDNIGRLVGTLTGGDSSCDSARLGLPDYYGMFSYHWDKNGTEPAKQLKPWLDPINAGVKSLNGWALSIGDKQLEEWITIYPNPAIDRVNVVISASVAKDIQVGISDIFGNQLRHFVIHAAQTQQNQFSLADLNSGMYLVSLSDGHHKVVRKIVKL